MYDATFHGAFCCISSKVRVLNSQDRNQDLLSAFDEGLSTLSEVLLNSQYVLTDLLSHVYVRHTTVSEMVTYCYAHDALVKCLTVTLKHVFERFDVGLPV